MFGLAIALSAGSALGRQWTDSSGKFSVEAEFVTLDAGNVTLKKSDGTLLKISLDRLSKPDQDEANKLAAQATPPAAVQSENPFAPQPATVNSPKPTKDEIVKLGEAATAFIEGPHHTEAAATCINSSGLFVTLATVVGESDKTDIKLVMHPGSKHQHVLHAQIASIDEQLNLALLRVEKAHDLPALSLGSADSVKEKMEVVTFGFRLPGSQPPHKGSPPVDARRGHAARLESRDGQLAQFILGESLRLGSPGAPVLDDSGKIVGILASGTKVEGGWPNPVIPVNRLGRFLKEGGKPAPPRLAKSADDQGKQNATLDATTVDLGEGATQVRTGGGGRFLIFHLKKAGKLAIVDVAKAAVVHAIEVPDDVRYAASQDKLLVVLPAQKLIQRYSLTDFQREKTASLPDDAPTFLAVMGCSSSGPLVLRAQQGRDYSAGKPLFWDIEKMAVLALPPDLVGGSATRISADGKSLISWTTGLSGQRFQLARLTAGSVEKLQTPDAHDYNGCWATPTADGSYVLRYGAGIYSKDLKVIPADAFAGCELMSCEDPRLMLAARIADRRSAMSHSMSPSASEVAIVTLNDQQILYTLKTPELESKEIIRTTVGYFSGEPRAHFLPALKTFVTFPESNDRVVIRKFDLAEALKQRKADYLFVVSKPPAETAVGQTFTYQSQVLTNGSHVKFKLESGPDGMKISDDGQVSWAVKQAPAGGAAKVIISVSADNGKEAFHSFTVSVPGNSAVAIAGPNPVPAVVRSTVPAPTPRSTTQLTAPRSPATEAQPSAAGEQIVQLGEPAAQVCAGGGGKYLIFHLKNAKKLAIVDVTKAAVVHSIAVPDDVRYAASHDKLLVVLPAQKVIQRYSLTGFASEKITALPADAPTFATVMGCGSSGPLVLRGPQGGDYSSGKLLFWDIETMSALPLPPDVVGGSQIRVSADGRTLIGWTTGISGQHFELARLTTVGVEKLRSTDTHDYNGWWATPTADGSYVLRDGAGIYSRDLKPQSSEALTGCVLIPCEDPRLMLAVHVTDQYTPVSSPRSAVAIVTLTDQQILYSLQAPEMESKAMISTERGYFGREPRVHYLPELKALVTFPETNDRVVIRKFDLAEALKQRGGDYLFVVSKPPAETAIGQTFTYRPGVLTNAGHVKFKLESGPEGMKVADDGQITWAAKQLPVGGAVRVVVSASADGGAVALHSFDLTVTRDRAEIATTPPPPATNLAGAAIPQAAELAAIGKFRLAASKAELAVMHGNDGQSLLVLQQNRLSILGPDGITIRKQVLLPKKYILLAEREKYYVAVAAEPQSIDLIDKASLRVSKSVKLPGAGATDLALHPTEPLAYVAYQAGFDIPRFRFLVFNEEAGEAHELDHCIGKWLRASPDGDFLMAAYSDLYVRGQQMVINPDNIFLVPEYGNIDWLIRYDLKNPERPEAVEKKDKAGGNGVGLRMAADGKRVTYLSHVGYPEFSGNLGGWDPTDLHKLPVSYATKDIATTQELAYHPLLPLVASFGKSAPEILDRQQRELHPDRVKLLDDEQLTGNIRRVYFTPDGRHLLFDAVVNNIHYLVQAELKLTPAELKQIANPPAPPKPRPLGRTT